MHLRAGQRLTADRLFAQFLDRMRRFADEQRAHVPRHQHRERNGRIRCTLPACRKHNVVLALCIESNLYRKAAIAFRRAGRLRALAESRHMSALIALACDHQPIARHLQRIRPFQRELHTARQSVHEQVHVLQSLTNSGFLRIVDPIPAGGRMMRHIAEHIRLAVADLHVHPAAFVGIRRHADKAGIDIVVLASSIPRPVARPAEIKGQVRFARSQVVQQFLPPFAAQARMIPDLARIRRLEHLKPQAAILERLGMIRLEDDLAGFIACARILLVKAVTDDQVHVLRIVIRRHIRPVLLSGRIELDRIIRPGAVRPRGLRAGRKHQQQEQCDEDSLHLRLPLFSLRAT